MASFILPLPTCFPPLISIGLSNVPSLASLSLRCPHSWLLFFYAHNPLGSGEERPRLAVDLQLCRPKVDVVGMDVRVVGRRAAMRVEPWLGTNGKPVFLRWPRLLMRFTQCILNGGRPAGLAQRTSCFPSLQQKSGLFGV